MKKNYIILTICILALSFCGCSSKQANSKIISQKQVKTYILSQKQVTTSNERARGISAYGEISIMPVGYEKVEQLGADSCYGKAADYSITGDYNVIYKPGNGKEKSITSLKNLRIIRPLNSVIELNRLAAGDTDIFYFIPEYSGSNDVEVRFFGITKQKEVFQFKIESNKARGYGDFNVLSDSTEVASIVMKDYFPPQIVNKDNIELIAAYSEPGAQDWRIYKVVFHADVKKHVLKYVSKEEIK